MNNHFIDTECIKRPKFEQCTPSNATDYCNIETTPISCYDGNELSTNGLSFYMNISGTCTAINETAGKNAITCDFADDECWSYRLNDNTI